MYKEYLDTVSVFETNGEVKPFGWSKEPIFFYNKSLEIYGTVHACLVPIF